MPIEGIVGAEGLQGGLSIFGYWSVLMEMLIKRCELPSRVHKHGMYTGKNCENERAEVLLRALCVSDKENTRSGIYTCKRVLLARIEIPRKSTNRRDVASIRHRYVIDRLS